MDAAACGMRSVAQCSCQACWFLPCAPVFLWPMGWQAGAAQGEEEAMQTAHTDEVATLKEKLDLANLELLKVQASHVEEIAAVKERLDFVEVELLNMQATHEEEVAALTVGLETASGGLPKPIERNATIPMHGRPRHEVLDVSAQQRTFDLGEHQHGVPTQVFEGEHAMTKDNNELGKSHLNGIPPAPRGIPRTEGSHDSDASGTLDASVQDKSLGKSKQNTFTSRKGRPSHAKVNRMVREAEKFRTEDDLKHQKIKAKNNLKNYRFTVRNAISQEEPQDGFEGRNKEKFEKAVSPITLVPDFEGERAKAKDNSMLGRPQGEGIPPAPCGIPQIEATPCNDANGTLNIPAITITNEKGRPAQADFDSVVRKAGGFRDDSENQKTKARNNLEIYCLMVRAILSKEWLSSEKVKGGQEKIETEVQGAFDWLDGNLHAGEDEIEAKHKELAGILNPILMEGSP